MNIASRCAKFINKDFNHTLSANCAESDLVQSFIDAGDSIAKAYEEREFSAAIREIMALADRANQYIDEKNRGHWQNKKVKNNKFMTSALSGLTCSVNWRFILRQYCQRLQRKYRLSYNSKVLILHRASRF